MALLQKLYRERGITVVLVMHDPQIARQTSRIVHLHDGRISHQEQLQ
jgi:predicted ABC-type transport system involved in lysophospholipase L1 biosynthesis ATPase subunit